MALKKTGVRSLPGHSGHVVITEITVPPTSSAEVQCEGGATYIICLDGTGTLDQPDGTWLMRDGFMAARSARWRARITAGPKRVRLVQFTWSAAGLSSLGSAATGLRSIRTLFGRSSVEMAWRAANELRLDDPYTPHALDLFANGVAIGLARNALYGAGTEPPRAARARRVLDRDLSRPLNLGALAKAAGCAPSHLSRLFRRTYGLSPSAYLLRRRVDKARQLLTDTELPASDIARQLGFHDASHFGRHFRRYAGVNPSAYRTRQRQVKSVPA